MNTSNRQSGFSHVIIVVIAVVLLGVVGYFAWQAFGKSAEDKANDAASSQARTECEKENDKDICKFLTNWKMSDKYRMVTTAPDSKTTYEIDGDRTRVVLAGDFAYETIAIGKTTYTKAGNTWYKQTLENAEQDITAGAKPDFKEPADDGETDAKDKTVYKKLGKEACGDLTCFKYEVVESENAETKEFIWFDDKDYKLRKSVSQSSEGSTETTYEYGNVSVGTPSPVKDLKPNQIIVPGQSEPQTMPSASDMGIE